MDFVAMEASEVAEGKSWAEQEQEQQQQQEKAERDGASAMDEEEDEGDESMEVTKHTNCSREHRPERFV